MSSPSGQDRTGMILLLALAAFALGQALQSGNGAFTFPAIRWLTAALIFAGTAIASARRALPRLSPKALWAVLLTALIWQLFQLLTALPGPGISLAGRPPVWQFRAAIALAGISALLSLAPRAWFHTWVRKGFIAQAFLAALVAGVWIIHAWPDPFIDVYLFQQSSSEALLQTKNPYELTPPNIYGGLKAYGPELVKDDKLTIGNPYPPLSIYLSFLGYAIAGDIRYACLAAILGAGLLIAFLRPGREALLAAYMLLFTPRGFFVLEQSWTEPLVLFLAVVVVWCAIHRPRWKFIALGLLLAGKQYIIFLLPVAGLLIPGKFSRRNWAAALGWSTGVAAAVTLPLALWNFPAFVWNVGWAQFYQPFRTDALSYPALYAYLTGQKPSELLAFVALAAAVVFAWYCCERSPAGFAAALAFCLAVFFAFNKQAFCNYYYLVVGMFCCALAAIPSRDNPFRSSLEEP